MSSAILYLAIIAIWAGVLIPRWLKRDASQAPKSSPEHADDQPAGADHDAHADEADGNMTDSDADAGLASVDAATRPSRDAGRERPGTSQPGHLETRARIVSARRRMLIILCTLTVAALGIAVLRLAAWWVAGPPVILLLVYLRLLRETSRADAEHALLEAAAWRDEQERRYERAAARAAAGPAASSADSSVTPSAAPRQAAARVIDISERVRDQFYDQYADGGRRAVGD